MEGPPQCKKGRKRNSSNSSIVIDIEAIFVGKITFLETRILHDRPEYESITRMSLVWFFKSDIRDISVEVCSAEIDEY